jgi:hypothetical protein
MGCACARKAAVVCTSVYGRVRVMCVMVMCGRTGAARRRAQASCQGVLHSCILTMLQGHDDSWCEGWAAANDRARCLCMVVLWEWSARGRREGTRPFAGCGVGMEWYGMVWYDHTPCDCVAPSWWPSAECDVDLAAAGRPTCSDSQSLGRVTVARSLMCRRSFVWCCCVPVPAAQMVCMWYSKVLVWWAQHRCCVWTGCSDQPESNPC